MKRIKITKQKTKNPFLEISSHLKTTPFSTQELVADKLGIAEIGESDLSFYPNLLALYIPGNDIAVLNHLEKNIRLTIIDARDNKITDLDLKRQTFLTDLYLSGNQLQDLDATLGKIAHLKNLETLDLKDNPLTLEKGYRQAVVERLPWLKVLDGHSVTGADRRGRVASRGAPQAPKKRAQTILQTLIERPLSAADVLVKKKAEKIRAETRLRRKREEDALTAVARKRNEEYQKKAQAKEIPIPDWLKPKNQQQEEKDEAQDAPAKKQFSRLWIKKPVYITNTNMTEDEERINRLNPDLPALNVRVTNEKAFAK